MRRGKAPGWPRRKLRDVILGVATVRRIASLLLAVALCGGASAQEAHIRTPENASAFMRFLLNAGGSRIRAFEPGNEGNSVEFEISSAQATSDRCAINVRYPAPVWIDESGEGVSSIPMSSIEVVELNGNNVDMISSHVIRITLTSSNYAARFADAAEVLRQGCDPTRRFGSTEGPSASAANAFMTSVLDHRRAALNTYLPGQSTPDMIVFIQAGIESTDPCQLRFRYEVPGGGRHAGSLDEIIDMGHLSSIRVQDNTVLFPDRRLGITFYVRETALRFARAAETLRITCSSGG